MTTAHNPHSIPLDPRVTLIAARKRFTHAYSYQEPITTSFGRVSGGGTRGGTLVKTGFNLRITNNEREMRSYYFSVGIFSDHMNKVLRTTIPRHVAHVHPGHTMEVDIELDQRDDFANAYLIDFVISQGSAVALAHFTPDYPLALAAEPDGPTEDDKDVDVFYSVVVIELLFVCLIIGSMLSYHYHFSALASWFWGIASFIAGCKALNTVWGRGLLYGLFTLIWGLLTFTKTGVLETLGVMAVIGVFHWWLRSPAREAQRKLQQVRSEIANHKK
jgi:hypothetical protein